MVYSNLGSSADSVAIAGFPAVTSQLRPDYWSVFIFGYPEMFPGIEALFSGEVETAQLAAMSTGDPRVLRLVAVAY